MTCEQQQKQSSSVTSGAGLSGRVPSASAGHPAAASPQSSGETKSIMVTSVKVKTRRKQANPRCRIIVTVSPVPLRATFLDQNVLISNSISKATLVVATHEFVARHDDVHYFPGYELVTVGIKKPLERDNRHVRRRAVARIMRVFEQMFVAG